MLLINALLALAILLAIGLTWCALDLEKASAHSTAAGPGCNVESAFTGEQLPHFLKSLPHSPISSWHVIGLKPCGRLRGLADPMDQLSYRPQTSYHLPVPKKDSSPVLTAIALGDRHANVAQVEHREPNLPLVHYCASFQKEQTDLATLENVRLAMPRRDAVGTTLLNHGQYELHQVEAPNVPKAELAQAVRWKLQEQLEYPADEASVDIVEVPSDPNRAADVKQLFAVSARNEVIRQRIQDFHAAKLPLSIIDIPELAQRNIARLYESDARAVGVLAFMAEGSLLTFVHGGELLVARQFDVTLSQLLEAAAENFEPTMERVALEIQRTYDHVDRRFHYAGVSRVMVSPLPKGSGAIEYLSANLSIRVQQIDLNEILDLSAVAQAQDPLWQTRHLHVIGAALRVGALAA